MKAIILAAGQGTRLRPMTDSISKPMVRIGGKPLLEYIIRLLKRYGIVDIFIPLNRYRDVVTNYFGRGAKWGVRISYSAEEKLLGTAGAVKKLESHFSNSFLVVYGDNLSNCNITQLINFHRERDGIGAIAVFEIENPTSSGIVKLNKEQRILKFLEKPTKKQIFSKLVNAGIYILEPRIFRYIPKGKVYDFGKDLFPRLLAEGEHLYGYIMTEYLLGIDTIEAYKRAQIDVWHGRFSLP